jgi:DNA-binding LacI/PurR family transcriptional regulator
MAVGGANVDGFIVHCFADGDPLLQAALARELPMVMVDNPDGFPYVAVDDVGGARPAAEHLIALGHHRLGIASLELSLDVEGGIIGRARQKQASYGPTRARLEGYRQAVEGAGLDWERDVAVYESSDNALVEGRNAVASLLACEPAPTAILAMSDQLALRALGYARDYGIDILADLSIVGFDDAPGAAQASPGLTTVHQPHVEKGRSSGRLLVELLRGNPQPAPVVLPTRLVLRESTARPPSPQEG